MPWPTDPESRARSRATYDTPEYRRNRKAAWTRAGGRCELTVAGRHCGSRDRCQVDHIINVASGGTHHLDNLRVLCKPHHDQKTATEGGGYRASRGTPTADPDLTTRTTW